MRITFLAGSQLPSFVSGLLVIAMVAIVAVRKLGPPPPERTTRSEREASAARWGNWLFVPALTIPAVALLGTFALEVRPRRRRRRWWTRSRSHSSRLAWPR